MIIKTNPYYLSHHGILGQKWGKRNGPPYPLGASSHSTSEKKAGWRKSLTKTSVDVKNGIARLIDSQDKTRDRTFILDYLKDTTKNPVLDSEFFSKSLDINLFNLDGSTIVPFWLNMLIR